MNLPRMLWFYRWHLFLMDLRQAALNLVGIVRFERPKIVQFVNGIWAAVWGGNMGLHATAIFAASPKAYEWMHSGLFAHVPTWSWGLTPFLFGVLQVHTLTWPIRQPVCRRKWAARLMLSWWSAMLTGFLLSGVPGNAVIFYAFLTTGSIWVLWRLSDRKEAQC